MSEDKKIMKIGYARVSTELQNLDLQLDKLADLKCTKVFKEKMSGKTKDRPVLREALDFLREEDFLVVYSLDRLGRNLKDLVSIVDDLQKRGIHFVSIKENIDTASPTGTLIFHIFCSLAQFERDLIRERTMAGLAAARARGRNGGRPRVLKKQKDIEMLNALHANKNIPIKDILQKMNISKASLYRYLIPENKK